jgi:hypothetical protein
MRYRRKCPLLTSRLHFLSISRTNPNHIPVSDLVNTRLLGTSGKMVDFFFLESEVAFNGHGVYLIHEAS